MPFPVLSTPRLLLRQLEDTDDKAIFSLRSDNRVNRFLERSAQTKIEESGAFIGKIKNLIAENNSIYWAIILIEMLPSSVRSVSGIIQLIGKLPNWVMNYTRISREKD